MESMIEHIKKFFESGNLITDVLDGVIDKDLVRQLLLFSVGIECGTEFTFYVEDSKWETVRLPQTFSLRDKYEKIEEAFSHSQYNIKCCRCIGGMKKETGQSVKTEQNIYVYYYFAVSSIINPTFLCCVEQAYYEWIARRLAVILRAVSHLEEYSVEPEEIKAFQHQVSVKFQEYMLEIHGIDVEEIIILSGINYEKEHCHSDFIFLPEDGTRYSLSGVTFDAPINFEKDYVGKGRTEDNRGANNLQRKSIKQIRKLLQMGKKGQCLLACKCGDTWQVKGLYKEKELIKEGITFRFMDHMEWSMRVGGIFAVCYKCGKYVVEERELELIKLKQGYEKVFNTSLKAEVERVFDRARCQKHGTILIIMKKPLKADGGIKEEVNRLVGCSSGMAIEIQKLPGEFVDSVTTIDGAFFIDEYGSGYGCGMILDGNTELAGDTARGARYNSTRKYIKTCKDKGMKAVGIVISEDGMIDVFTTQDSFDEEGKNE